MLKSFRLYSGIYNAILNYLTKKIDLLLLVYLLMILNARLGLNIVALFFIFLLRRDLKVKLNGITYFYISIIILSLISFFITDSNFGYPKFLTIIVSCVLWLFCLLNFHQLWLSLKKNSVDTVINTIKLLTLINFFASLFYLIKIMILRGTINPYTEDAPPPYGINTGDMIGGVFGGNHDVNSIICAMLFMFFMFRKDFKFAFFALIPHLLTGNNFILILLLGYIVYLFVFSKSKILKYYALFSGAIILVFYVKITTPNYYYMTQKLHIGTKSPHDFFLDKFQKNSEDVSLKKSFEIDSLYNLWNADNRLRKAVPLPLPETIKIPEITTHNPTSDVLKDTALIVADTLNNRSTEEKTIEKSDSTHSRLVLEERQPNNWTSYTPKSPSSFEDKITDSVRKLNQEKVLKERYLMLRVRDSVLAIKTQNIPSDMIGYDLDSTNGKLISFIQTKNYLFLNWKNFLIGSGPGGFSSRLAFMHSDLIEQQTRFLTWLPDYETEAFKKNHKTIYQYILYQDTSYNTFSNKPFSFYNEIFGEYGMIGFICWIFLYVGFFIRRWKYLTYTRFIFLFTLVVLATDYWYHGLTMIVILELLTLIDLKINNHQKTFVRNE